MKGFFALHLGDVVAIFLRHALCFLLACIPPEVYNMITKEKAMKLFMAGGSGFMGRTKCGIWSAEFGIKVFYRFNNKIKERSDTTIPHSEIHIPHSLHREPIY